MTYLWNSETERCLSNFFSFQQIWNDWQLCSLLTPTEALSSFPPSLNLILAPWKMHALAFSQGKVKTLQVQYVFFYLTSNHIEGAGTP